MSASLSPVYESFPGVYDRTAHQKSPSSREGPRTSEDGENDVATAEQQRRGEDNPSTTGSPTTPKTDVSSGRTADVANTSEFTNVESEEELHRRNSMVQELARQFTHDSMADGGRVVAELFFLDDPDSPLNPHSEKFSAFAWTKEMASRLGEMGRAFQTSGICFRDLSVFGYGNETDYQKNVSNIWLEVPGLVRRFTTKDGGQRHIDILRNFDGVVNAGEMLVVLGPPGAGCTTLLKTVAGEISGLYVDNKSYFNYQGITAHEMHKHHSGEVIYTAEVDVHFPMLSVGDTLTFASRARCPRNLPKGVNRNRLCNHLRDVIMASYGISHTVNTRVGNEYVRGVSGGERKRVTIAEATLSHAPLQCWDNSTRGLDSANALEFCKTLRHQADLFGQTSLVSIYQSPQSAYDLFDKVILIYEGRQIFFGDAKSAKEYFENLGFDCPARQTTPDFLTSMTSPLERIVRPGWEDRVPRTPDEFAACWQRSENCKALRAEIERYIEDHPINGPDAEAFRALKHSSQDKKEPVKSPYILSYGQQVRLCLWRGFRRLIGSPGLTIFSLIANSAMALIISSLFYDMQPTTGSFYSRSAILFTAILFNAFSSALEILTQYAQRPIVEKHARYAFHRPSAEAFSSVIVDLPYKVLNAICFNLILYFMTNLNRAVGPFFYYLLVTFLMVLTMSGIFRSMSVLSLEAYFLKIEPLIFFS